MARYRHACRECWDPVDREDAELCDWFMATPEERNRRMLRAGLWLAAIVAVLLLGMFILPAAPR